MWQVGIYDVSHSMTTEPSPLRISDLLTMLDVDQHCERVDEFTYLINLPPTLERIVSDQGSFDFTWEGLQVVCETP